MVFDHSGTPCSYPAKQENEEPLTTSASAQLRSQIINLFLTRFTLSEVELSALTSRDIAVGQPVFDALDKVERIRKDCYTLLGGEEGTQQAG